MIGKPLTKQREWSTRDRKLIADYLRAVRQYRHFRKNTSNALTNSDECLKSAIAVVSSLFLAGVIVLGCSLAHADVSDSQAVLAIIGEAENQGATGMLAVACAIRNRDTLRGVYCVNAPRVKQKKYSQKTYDLAKQSWEKSASVDIVNGADHWENINAFGRPYWADSMTETYRHKDHVFFKEVKK